MEPILFKLSGTAYREDKQDNVHSFISGAEVTIELEAETTDEVSQMMSRNASNLAEKHLQEVEGYAWDSRKAYTWKKSVYANANEILEYASSLADDSDSSVVDILLRWLQRTSSMRVRRALSVELSSEGLDVSEAT